jgi:hypothetical protein
MYIPLDSPLHGRISDNHWRQPVEDLVSCASESVENCAVCGASEWSLTVRREAVGSDTLLWCRSYCSISREVCGKVREEGRSHRGGLGVEAAD